MTEGEKTSGPARYWPTLDGVRAVAIIAVIAYHLGDLGGGWLGVDVFFVLSGYLITSLLLAERRRTRRDQPARLLGPPSPSTAARRCCCS